MPLGDCEEGFVDMVGFSPVSIVGWILLGVTFGLVGGRSRPERLCADREDQKG